MPQFAASGAVKVQVSEGANSGPFSQIGPREEERNLLVSGHREIRSMLGRERVRVCDLQQGNGRAFRISSTGIAASVRIASTSFIVEPGKAMMTADLYCSACSYLNQRWGGIDIVHNQYP